MAVTVIDDDVPSTKVMLTVAPSAGIREDAGGARGVQVTGTLDGAARGSDTVVTVTVSSGTATAGTDFDAVADFPLTILADQTSGTAVFDFTPVDDDVFEGDETVAVSGSTTVGLAVDGAVLTIVEDDVRGIVLSRSAVTVTEGEPGVTYTVALTSEPTGTVTVHGDAPAGSDVRVASSGTPALTASLTFTTTNWETPQPFTVTGVDDADGADDTGLEISHRVAGADYQGLTVTDTVAVTIDDDDVPGIHVDPAMAQLTEGDEIELRVKLDARPIGGNVTVTLAVPSELSANPSSLTFTSGNWDRLQTVTVEALRDDDARPLPPLTTDFTIGFAASGADYAGVTESFVLKVLEKTGPATGKPKISGTAAVGQTLTAGTSGIEDPDGKEKAENGDAGYAYSYQWIRVSGASEIDIAGATGSSYTLVEADADKSFKVRVRFTDDAGHSEGPLTSDAWTWAKDGELRLVDNDGPANPGRLEVFYEGEWGTVSDDRMDNPRNIAPQLACQFMGYATGELVPRSDITNMSVAASQRIWLDDVRCFAAPEDNRTGKTPTELSQCFHAGWGLTNSTHEEDVHLRCTGNGTPEQTEATPLTASFENMPANHDGSSAFTFRIAFSADVDITPENMRDHALTVTGATVTNATRVDGRSDLWELTLEPAGTGEVSILVQQNRACTEAGALCTTEGQALSTGLGHNVPGPGTQNQPGVTPLGASFVAVPAEHDGETEFWLELSFDAAVEQGSKQHIRALLGVTGGSETRVRRKDGRLDHWRVRVEPSSHEAVTVTLSPSPACGETGAVCTPDGRTFTTAIATRIQGPPGLAVADAEVQEAANATLAFAVTLSRAPSGTVTVDYATGDGTAEAGSDYTATSGTLTFASGETGKTVSVPVLDDAHDEGSETLTLTLSNPSGAYIEDGEATGTIVNTDPMPKAWLARFGRTVAEQVRDAVEARLEASREPGANIRVAGQQLGGEAPDAEALEEAEAKARLEALAGWLQGETCSDGAAPGAGDCPAGTKSESREVTGRDFLTGTAFTWTGGSEETGSVALWGQGAITRFDGRDGDLTLDGEVSSAMLGADRSYGRGTAGLVLSHSRGAGEYRSPGGGGEVESTVTGLYPYGRYELTERTALWGVAGYGEGELVLTPEGKTALETDMDLAMAAAGLKGTVLDGGGDGPALALEADGFAVRATSDGIIGLPASDATVTRLRLGAEGSWQGLSFGGGTLTPSLEVGIRHDGGDAERGFGADIGAGLAWSDPVRGIEAELKGRGLLTHEDSDFRERGFSGSLSWDPTAGSDLGPSLTLTQSVGGQASGGMDALLGRDTMAGLAANDDGELTRRLEAVLGYGVPVFGDRFIGHPGDRPRPLPTPTASSSSAGASALRGAGATSRWISSSRRCGARA